MNNTYSLTATYHPLDFNVLSPEEFVNFCLWLAIDSGEYKNVELYDGPGDKNRDVIGYSFEKEIDYFQCKRYKKSPVYGELKAELDELNLHIQLQEIKRPRSIYFVLSTDASAKVKDDIKKYARYVGLPEPIFWEHNILDKKIWKNENALKKFFNLSYEANEKLPEVDVDGQIAYGTDDYRFSVVNNGDATAIDCKMYLIGFGQKYPMPASPFNLNQHEKKEVRMGIPGNFLKLDPWKELRIRFIYRDNKNNWYSSERLLNIERVAAFYRIKAETGNYIPAQPLPDYSIESIDFIEDTRLLPARLITYKYKGERKNLKIEISYTLIQLWGFDSNWLDLAFNDIAEKIIEEMIKKADFKEELYIKPELLKHPIKGFDAYLEVRNNILEKGIVQI